MKYEQFLANAAGALSAVQAALSAVPGMVRKNERLEKENAELKDNNLRLIREKAGGCMELPRDADGEPIRIGDEVNVDGDAMTVLGYCLHDDMLLLITEDKKRGLFFVPQPSRVCHFKPEPADSWEKLEEDMMKRSSCNYFGIGFSMESCNDCPHGERRSGTSCFENTRRDMLARAKKLAGIEEAER